MLPYAPRTFADKQLEIWIDSAKVAIHKQCCDLLEVSMKIKEDYMDALVFIHMSMIPTSPR